MDSAISPHLRCPRTQPLRMPADHVPVFLGWSSVVGPERHRIAIGHFGIQAEGPGFEPTVDAASAAIRRMFGDANGPDRYDFARHTDEAGYDNHVFIAYWLDYAAYTRWVNDPDHAAWWDHPERLDVGIGFFREVFTPSSAGFETLIADPAKLVALSAVLDKPTAQPICEHAYWGGMRDRIGRSQTDPLAPEGTTQLSATQDGRRIKLSGPENVAVIRSGQNWNLTRDGERARYLESVAPKLRAGMMFLRDEGRAIGCINNAFMRVRDDDGHDLNETFGYSLWRSLEALEAWSEHHPTHLAIVDAFLNMLKVQDNATAVNLYHEVYVLKSSEQFYEYINCHPGTGMLNAPETQLPATNVTHADLLGESR